MNWSCVFIRSGKDKAETLHVFHRFQANNRYSLKMFRDRSARSSSLLNASAPDPLCVDLVQEQKTIRRFCKPYNAVTGIAEFVRKENLTSVRSESDVLNGKSHV